MIKINLLRNLAGATTGAGPSQEFVSSETKTQAAVRLGVILLFPLLLFGYERLTLNDLDENVQKAQTRLQALNAEKAKFGDAGPRVERYNKEKARVDQEMGVIRALARNRLKEVKALDALQSLVPNKTWLRHITIEGSVVKLSGFTSTEEGVSEFIKALESSMYFSHVEPKSTSSETVAGAPVKKFELEFKVGKQD